MTAASTNQLVRPDAIRAMAHNHTALEEEILLRLADIGAANPEVFAALQRTPDVDVQRSGEEPLADHSLEHIGEFRHSDTKVTNTESDLTSDFHLGPYLTNGCSRRNDSRHRDPVVAQDTPCVRHAHPVHHEPASLLAPWLSRETQPLEVGSPHVGTGIVQFDCVQRDAG